MLRAIRGWWRGSPPWWEEDQAESTKEYAYETCCVHSTAEAIHAMTENAQTVTWETFRRHVPIHEVMGCFPYYSYRGEDNNPVTKEQTIGYHIKDDWAVGFWRSEYRGKPCYYITHSGIEYIWTKEAA